MNNAIKGYNINFPLTKINLESINNFNIKNLRVQFLGNSTTSHTWNQSQQNNIFDLNGAMPDIQRLGLKIIIDMHHWPFIEDNYSLILFSEEIQRVFISRWRSIASEFKKNSAVIGYELMNEPPAGYGKLYRPFITKLIKAIREVDQNKEIIIASTGTTANQFLKTKPFPCNNLAYAFHLWDWPRLSKENTKMKWSRARKLQAIELFDKIKKWQKDNKIYNNQINVTEVGCFRYSGYPDHENAKNFFNDILPLLNKAGWNYYLHSFRDADCWDYEKGNNPNNHDYIFNDVMGTILRHTQ